MPHTLNTLAAFSAGEWSPTLDSRVDLPGYRKACRKLRNMIPMKQGGATRRPGTQYLGNGGLNRTGLPAVSRLESFQYAPGTTFQLEFCDYGIRFWTNGARVTVSTSGVPFWISPSANIFTAGSFSVGQGYKIVSLTGTTQAQWNTTAGTSGVTYVVGSFFVAATVGAGTGTAGLVIAYPAGQYLFSPITGLMYYNTVAGWAPNDPSIDTTRFIQQTTLQVPTPYSATGTTDLNGNVTAFTAPDYWATDVFQLQFKQINDVIYIVHPNFPVWKLTRYSNNNWVMQQVQFLAPAMLDENNTDLTISASAISSVSGPVQLLVRANNFWTTGYVYVPGNTVYAQPDGSSVVYIYVCLVAHTSGNFSNDLSAGNWRVQQTFNSKHVGSYWQMAYNRPVSNIEFDAGGSSSSYSFSSGTWVGDNQLYLVGTWEVQTYGAWYGDVVISVSYDNGVTFQRVTTLTSSADANYSISGKELTGGIYTFSVQGATTGTASSTPPRIVLTADNQFVYGLVQITSVTDINTAYGNVIGLNLYYPTKLQAAWNSSKSYNVGDIVSYSGTNWTCVLPNVNNTPVGGSIYWTANLPITQFWSEGAWSNYRGYPQAITVYQERMWYGATAFQPQRIWGTQTNDIENFALIDQSQPTYGLAFDLNAPGRGPINWMNAQTDLMIGLAAAEWIVSSGQPNTAISPTSVTALEHSANGSAAYLQGQIIGNAAFYVQRRGTNFQQMLFSVFTNKYMSQDVLTYSQHLTNSGIQQFDYQQEFENQSILWAVCGDGSLISMTYSLEQEIFAWARHDTGQDNGDKILSVSVIYGANGQDDEVWVSVLRNPATAKGCTIERIWPISWQTDNVGQPLLSEACYVDCATYVVIPGGTTPNTFSGLPTCLYNRPLVAAVIPASGTGIISFRNLTCSNTGSVTLANYVPAVNDVVWIGLPIQWYLQPMRLDVDQRAGEVVGLTRAISKLYVRVVNSIGGQWATTQGDIVDIQCYPITENSGNPPPFYPNVPLDLELDVGGLTQYELDATFTLQGTDPLPMTVLGVTIKQDIGGAP